MTSADMEKTLTGQERYRFVVSEPLSGLSFYDVHADVTGLDRMLFAVGLAEHLSQNPGGAAAASKEQLREAESTAQFVPANARVLRLTYNSPIEIVVGLGVAVTVGITYGHRLLGLFDRFQMSRLTKAEVDAKVAAYNAITEMITGSGDPDSLRELEHRGGLHLAFEVGRAADLMAKLDDVEALPPTQA